MALQPLIKRSITFVKRDDSDLAEKAVTFGNQHEFGDMSWYPGHGKVIYRIDDRVPSTVSGNGLNDFVGFQSTATVLLGINRLAGRSISMIHNFTHVKMLVVPKH